MSTLHTIVYLRNKDINRTLWDRCMDGADNSLIYGYSFYLDAFCDHWDGLVLDNYEGVMPLPWRKKWGISYLYHPPFTAQLGVFGRSITADVLHLFLAAIPPVFRYWDFPLNYRNVFALPSYPLYQRSNYVLGLNKPYTQLQAAYRTQTKRNIKKTVAAGCIIKKGIAVADVIPLSRNGAAPALTEKEYAPITKLYQQLLTAQKALTYGVYGSNGTLLASAIFFFLQGRAYYILAANSSKGKKCGAAHLLIDTFISHHAQQNMELDFEGSDIPGLAFFYSSFGARNEPYAAIHYNKLPLYLKWLKK